MLYCIKHGRMELEQIEWTVVKKIYPDGAIDERALPVSFVHEVIIPAYKDSPEDLDWCEFDEGWATCPPPDDQDWLERVTE